MKHEIKLEKYNVRCDLISETIEDNELINKTQVNDITIEKVEINKANEKNHNKSKGNYVTIRFNDVTDYTNRNNLINVLTTELKKIISNNNLNDKKVLIVGLGNHLSTADSLGPKTIEKIIVTRHLYELKEVDKTTYTNTSVISPGVYAQTGIESYEIIKGIVHETKPDYIIAIDALASTTIQNVNKIIQITDSGIEPGSGIGNNRKELSYKTLKVPVIAIGVPTVVEISTIVKDTINLLSKKITYDILNLNNPKTKLEINKDYNTSYNLDEKERTTYLGLIGNLNNEEIKTLFNEVLTPTGFNYIVTPKEIDFTTEKMSIVIAKSINEALNNI